MALADPLFSLPKVQALFHFFDSAKGKFQQLTVCMPNGVCGFSKLNPAWASLAFYTLCTGAGFMMWISMAFLDLSAGTRVMEGLNEHVLPALQLLNGLLALIGGFSIVLGQINMNIHVNTNRSRNNRCNMKASTLSQRSKMIRALPKEKYGSLRRRSDDVNRNDCAICLGCIGDEDGVRILPNCRHHFHISCIDRWLFPSTASNSSCPLCRATVIGLNSSQGK